MLLPRRNWTRSDKRYTYLYMNIYQYFSLLMALTSNTQNGTCHRTDLSTKIFSNIYISFLLALALYCNPTLESNKLTHAVFIIQRE